MLLGVQALASAAAIGSAWALVSGDRHPAAAVVFVAAAMFAAIAAFWLRRDQGAPVDPGSPIPSTFRAIIGLATVSAAAFGLLPLLLPGPFATLFGLAGTDVWIFRMAGAACLGYAVAGVLELGASGYATVRFQNRSAIAFNVLGAVAAWLALAAGDGGLLAPVVAVAATFFAIALFVLDRRSLATG